MLFLIVIHEWNKETQRGEATGKMVGIAGIAEAAGIGSSEQCRDNTRLIVVYNIN